MTIDLIKEYIKESLLVEKAFNTRDASKENLALVVIKDKIIGRQLILLDPDGLLDLASLANAEKHVSDAAFRKCIYAIISVEPPYPRPYGSYEVHQSAAVNGYGPLIYDAALSIFGPLCADRNSVSPSAENIWNYYKNNRKDVEALLIDDYDDPKTKTKKDDGEVYTLPTPLNYVYKLKSPKDFSKLIQKGKSFMVKYTKSISNFDVPVLNDLVDDFFASKYKG